MNDPPSDTRDPAPERERPWPKLLARPSVPMPQLPRLSHSSAAPMCSSTWPRSSVLSQISIYSWMELPYTEVCSARQPHCP